MHAIGADPTSSIANRLVQQPMSTLPTANATANAHSDPSTGFSHGAYASNTNTNGNTHHGFADRSNRRSNNNASHNHHNIPAINTSNSNPNTNSADINNPQPGSAYDMNFAPFLPSQLLLGSPFQPGTPSAFASPQFPGGFGTFSQANAGGPAGQNPQNPLASPTHPPQNALSPQLYQSLIGQDGGLGGAGSQLLGGPQSPGAGGFTGYANNAAMNPNVQVPGILTGTSRTVYLGNLPPETSAEEILSHIRSGQIESVRLLPDKNCAFISFLDSSSATHFHSDAILKKLSIKGNDIKIGWGKPSQVPTSVALAVQQSGASRNVYLGNLPEDTTEDELREELGKFGPIDTVKLVKEKSIGFVHFLSISNAIKAVSQLPQEPKWQAPKRVYYGKDRCAYVSKTQQQNAAQYLGIAPGYAHVLNSADRDLISNALAQQSVAAAAVATTAGGVNNLGNRTVYLGNIHPETTIEEICNVVRGGLLHHIRYIPDKHICFVTFIDPTSAASFYALSNLQGLMIHNRRLKVGWGKHSGALPPAIALAVSGGASRNVYIGNLDETWPEDRLRQDFSAYGEIELVNTLREKSCAFVNFTNIANAIKAIEGMRGREEYKRFKINFGKDRCGNPPRQLNSGGQQQQQSRGPGMDPNQQPSPLVNGNLQAGFNQGGAQSSPTRPAAISPAPASTGSQNGHGNQQPRNSFQAGGATPSSILNSGGNNPLTLYLNQVSQHQAQEQDNRLNNPMGLNMLQQQQQQQQHQVQQAQQQQHQQQRPPQTHPSMPPPQQAGLYNDNTNSLENTLQQKNSGPSLLNVTSTAGPAANNTSSSTLNVPRAAQHSRAVSLPSFSQDPPFGAQSGPGVGGNGVAGGAGGRGPSHHVPTRSGVGHHHQAQGSFSGFGAGAGLSGLNHNGFGLGIPGGDGSLPGWAEEEIGAK